MFSLGLLPFLRSFVFNFELEAVFVVFNPVPLETQFCGLFILLFLWIGLRVRVNLLLLNLLDIHLGFQAFDNLVEGGLLLLFLFTVPLNSVLHGGKERDLFSIQGIQSFCQFRVLAKQVHGISELDRGVRELRVVRMPCGEADEIGPCTDWSPSISLKGFFSASSFAGRK